MKFQPDRAEGVNVITRHEPGRVWVGSVGFEGGVVVPWTGTPVVWQPRGFEELREEHFSTLLEMKPALVIFGSGAKLRFPKPEWLRSLVSARVGLEAMDTAAACRTYNVLASERRSVVAALLPS
ncbi:MAG: Mth938-like domain-containing protein [Rubrivivax sp.]